MEKEIQIIHVRVGQPPVVKTVQNELNEFNKLVGGHLECIDLDGFDLICNEEGEIRDLPLNRIIPAQAPEVPEGIEIIYMDDNLAEPGQMGEWRIKGDFFICRHDDDGDFASLQSEDIEKLIYKLRNT